MGSVCGIFDIIGVVAGGIFWGRGGLGTHGIVSCVGDCGGEERGVGMGETDDLELILIDSECEFVVCKLFGGVVLEINAVGSWIFTVVQLLNLGLDWNMFLLDCDSVACDKDGVIAKSSNLYGNLF